jgi:4-hydroxyphenylpyruvate dioxygenase
LPNTFTCTETAVRVIALWVDDARHAWHETTSRGAVSVEEPHIVSDEHGTAVLASIRTYGDTIHTFVERSGYSGHFFPASAPSNSDPSRARSAFSTSITWWATSAGMR